jgi:hypothetical protein
MHVGWKHSVAVIVSALVITGSTIPASYAGNPVPGRFCKASDIDKKVMTSKYGLVKCKKDGSNARWKAIKSRNFG